MKCSKATLIEPHSSSRYRGFLNREHRKAFKLITNTTAARPTFAASISPETIRSEEHTSELQSLMRISYAVFCLKNNQRYKSYFIVFVCYIILCRKLIQYPVYINLVHLT